MSINVIRKNVIFQPDSSRVIARFFDHGSIKAPLIIKRILDLTEQEQKSELGHVLRRYAKRHRNILKIFEKHFQRTESVLNELQINPQELGLIKRLLIGAFFTMEYSIESAAFFNPSVVLDPDQSRTVPGETRVIISFRATGEGHISSIVFRSAVLNIDNDIMIEPPGTMLESPAHIRNFIYDRDSFLQKLRELNAVNKETLPFIEERLPEKFSYEKLKIIIEDARNEVGNDARFQVLLNETKWLASSHYEMDFSLDTDISERVIFPIKDTEKNGIEDARFVRFVDDDGSVFYYATYTAYDGRTILPKILMTQDFYHFKVLPVHGDIVRNKGLALFPRKINGKYAMLCRVDGVNNYLAYSDNINRWPKAELIQKPLFPWEFVQIGNCGSPIETESGWLVITHGVGPMREYVLGVSLFDLTNPEVEIGRLKQPLIVPNQQEREGYVPNVVYSCGSMIHNNHLIIPYAMSDYASTYAVVNLTELLDELLDSSAKL